MAVGLSDKNRHAKKEWTPQVESLLPEQKVLARRHLRYELKQLGVVAERSEVAVFVLRHHTRMIANQDGSVYSTRCSAAYAVTGRTNGRDVRSIPNSSPKLSWR
jgi:hypothetical protein